MRPSSWARARGNARRHRHDRSARSASRYPRPSLDARSPASVQRWPLLDQIAAREWCAQRRRVRGDAGNVIIFRRAGRSVQRRCLLTIAEANELVPSARSHRAASVSSLRAQSTKPSDEQDHRASVWDHLRRHHHPPTSFSKRSPVDRILAAQPCVSFARRCKRRCGCPRRSVIDLRCRVGRVADIPRCFSSSHRATRSVFRGERPRARRAAHEPTTSSMHRAGLPWSLRRPPGGRGRLPRRRTRRSPSELWLS